MPRIVRQLKVVKALWQRGPVRRLVLRVSPREPLADERDDARLMVTAQAIA